MWRYLSIMIFCSCIPWVCFSEGRVVNGVVRNEAGESLGFVDVEEKRTGVSMFCDEAGRFSLDFPSDTVQTVEILFSLIGYQPVTRMVHLSGDTMNISVVMKESFNQIDQIEVVGQAKQETTSENLSVKVTKTIPHVSGDGIIGVVTTQPGVSTTNELSSQYSVRGGNYDENCVYVNSIEVYRPQLIRSGEQEGLSFMNPDLVQSVSFSSGGFSPEYGDRMSSVLDIKYKTPSSFEGSASVSFLGASAYVGSSSSRFSQLHGFRYKTSSYLLNSLETRGEYDPKFLDYQTYLTYSFSSKWKLSFLGNLSRNIYNFIPKSRSTNLGTMAESYNVRFNFDGQERDLFSTCFGAFTLTFHPSSPLTLDFIASSFRSIEHVTYDIASTYDFHELFQDGTLGAKLGSGNFHEHSRNAFDGTVSNISHKGMLKLNRNTVKWGLSFQLESLGESVSEWEKRDSAGYSLPLNPDRMSLYSNLSGDLHMLSHRVSGFVQDAYTIRSGSRRFVILGGLRFSYWDFNEQIDVSPRASFAFFPAKSSWVFRVATGIYHQALMFKEVKKEVVEENGNHVVVLNRDVLTPRSSQIILASDYYFRKWNRPFKLTGELYYKYIDRIIPYRVDNMKLTYRGENCADGFAFGGDVKLFGEFVPGTDSWISVSLMNTEENVYGDGCGYFPRPTDQRYNFSMFFQDYVPDFEKLKFNIKFVWAGGYPFRSPYPGSNRVFRMTSYKRVDIGVAYQFERGVDAIMSKKAFSWMKTLSLNLDVFNLLGNSNVNSYYWIPMANGDQKPVPNYLTGRLFNLKLAVYF